MKKIIRVFSILIVCNLWRVAVATNINSFKTLGLDVDKELIASKILFAQNEPNGDQNTSSAQVDSKLPQINLPTVNPLPVSQEPAAAVSPVAHANEAVSPAVSPVAHANGVVSPAVSPVVPANGVVSPAVSPLPASQEPAAKVGHNKKHQKTKGGNKKVAYHDLEFEKREIDFLFAPDDDVVNGKLTFDAYVDRMDYYEYIQLFKLNYVSEEEKIKADHIRNYLKHYHDFKKKNK